MSNKSNQNFNAGDLVVLRVINKHVTKDGWSTVGTCSSPKSARLYEFINAESYPSTNDFSGKTVTIKDGTQGIIIKKIGRPWRILSSNRWHQYDIYEVLFKGYTCQVFDHNLEHASEQTRQLVSES